MTRLHVSNSINLPLVEREYHGAYSFEDGFETASLPNHLPRPTNPFRLSQLLFDIFFLRSPFWSTIPIPFLHLSLLLHTIFESASSFLIFRLFHTPACIILHASHLNSFLFLLCLMLSFHAMLRLQLLFLLYSRCTLAFDTAFPDSPFHDNTIMR